MRGRRFSSERRRSSNWGQLIPEEAAAAASVQSARLAVGLSDGLSKLAAHVLLKPILDTPSLKLVCHEGEVDELLAELALHRSMSSIRRPTAESMSARARWRATTTATT